MQISFERITLTRILPLIALCAFPVTLAEPPSAANPRDLLPYPTSDLEHFIRAYAADRADLLRFYDLPWSEAHAQRAAEFYRQAEREADAIAFENLNTQGKIDYLLLRRHLQHQFRLQQREREWLAEMAEFLPFREAILSLEIARRRMEPCEPREAARLLAGLPERINELRERCKPDTSAGTSPSPPLPSAIALRTARATEALRGALESWYAFYDGFHPDFGWWVRESYEKTHVALTEYAGYLREVIAGVKGADDDPLIGTPLGATALAEELEREFLSVTPRDLIRIGERELAWCEEELKRAADAMGLGDDWKAALERVKEDHVPPGEQADLVAAEGRAAIQFLRQHDLITIPPLAEETWNVQMLSPESQKYLPYAAYGGQKMLAAYSSADMPFADKLMSMRGNNRHFTRLVTPHELIPGHHLQDFMATRHRPYRSLFATPFFVEGWALYWELTFWEQGYARTPEERIGMLFWRMHRAARIVVSLKFHLGEITPPEMIEFLADRVGHERFGATSEVRRYIGDDYSPLYQCSYLIGGLQLRALREEVLGSQLMSEREAHDRLLTYGAIPVILIRADMLNLDLSDPQTLNWNFSNP